MAAPLGLVVSEAQRLRRPYAIFSTAPAVERRVATLHNQHHFRDFSRWFHVSPGGVVIDRALGTAITREALRGRQRAEFMRTLGLPPDDPRLVAARRRFAARYGLTEAEIARAAR